MRFESVMRLREKLDELGKMKGIAQDEKGIKTSAIIVPFLDMLTPYKTLCTDVFQIPRNS